MGFVLRHNKLNIFLSVLLIFCLMFAFVISKPLEVNATTIAAIPIGVLALFVMLVASGLVANSWNQSQDVVWACWNQLDSTMQYFLEGVHPWDLSFCPPAALLTAISQFFGQGLVYLGTNSATFEYPNQTILGLSNDLTKMRYANPCISAVSQASQRIQDEGLLNTELGTSYTPYRTINNDWSFCTKLVAPAGLYNYFTLSLLLRNARTSEVVEKTILSWQPASTSTVYPSSGTSDYTKLTRLLSMTFIFFSYQETATDTYGYRLTCAISSRSASYMPLGSYFYNGWEANNSDIFWNAIQWTYFATTSNYSRCVYDNQIRDTASINPAYAPSGTNGISADVNTKPISSDYGISAPDINDYPTVEDWADDVIDLGAEGLRDYTYTPTGVIVPEAGSVGVGEVTDVLPADVTGEYTTEAEAGNGASWTLNIPILGKLLQALIALWNLIKNGFNTMLAWISALITNVISAIQSAAQTIADTFSLVPNKLQSLWDLLKQLVDFLTDQFVNIGQFAIAVLGFISGYTLFQSLFNHYFPSSVATILWAFWCGCVAVWIFRMILNR